MNEDDNIKDELVRPRWRNVKAFSHCLGNDYVEEKIVETISDNYDRSDPLKVEQDPKDEVKYFLPSLKDDIRITDLGDWKYWFYLLGLTLLYIVADLLAVGAMDIGEGKQVVIVSIISVLVLLIISSVYYAYNAVYSRVYPGKVLDPVLGLSPSNLHTLPVIVSSLGVVFINAMIVWYTGISKSPFLPALISIAVVVASIPRVNSIPVITVIFVLVCIISALFLIEPSARTVDTTNFDTYNVRKIVNFSTFIYSIITVCILRQIRTFNIGPKNA